MPAAELHAEVLASDGGENDDSTPEQSREGTVEDRDNSGGVEFDVVGANGEVLIKSNRLTVDSSTRQTLTMEEIESLKKANSTESGKAIIRKILEGHNALDEKTSFSLAKYTLRKSRKYLKRFTVLPCDVGRLGEVMTEKGEGSRVLEVREEAVGLMGAWSNAHWCEEEELALGKKGEPGLGNGRWLVVDDTSGLMVAALAERMGILYPRDTGNETEQDQKRNVNPGHGEEPNGTEIANSLEPNATSDTVSSAAVELPDADAVEPQTSPSSSSLKRKQADCGVDATTLFDPPASNKRPRHHETPPMSCLNNTITVVHANAQPNLGLLKYFAFDTSSASPSHPLYTHLKTITWLQLLHPGEDPSYTEPELVPEEEVRTWKSGKRGGYYRKRRRWERVKRVVDETRAGMFDGLVIATQMDLLAILRHLIPLIRGGGTLTIYSPTIEPLTAIMDLYSKDRRAAYIQASPAEQADEEDFPLNPTLLLGPSLQTARIRDWQVLPGRTHPVMTSRGGPEGYVFTATRVHPAMGKVEARGKFQKKKRAERGYGGGVEGGDA